MDNLALDALATISKMALVKNCSEGSSNDNGLQLNLEILEQLYAIRSQIETAIKQVEERYKNNQIHISNLLCGRVKCGIGKRGAYLRGSTFYFKGNMFFKDANFRNCPNNSDYNRRCSIEKETFPMDWELCGRHVWSMVDKMGIVHGIKEQIENFLNNENKVHASNLQRKIAVHSKKLVNLLPQVENTSFKIDWHEISAVSLRYRHSACSCQAMWELYLHPKLIQGAWTQAENHRLINAATKNKLENWKEIANSVGNRSEYQCFIQYFTRLHRLQPNRWSRWNKSDDQRLLECIKKYSQNGIINWNVVASHFPHKSKTTLQGRYAYSINPKISHAPFTNEEDVLLLAAVKEYGTKFNCMPRNIFPHRSLAQLRSRYHNVLETRHKQHPWTIEDDQQLLEFVAKKGTSEWLLCSEELKGRHSRTSCRTRFMTIQRYFERNPKATLAELPRLKCKRTNKKSVINTKNWEERIIEMQLEQFLDQPKEVE